MQEASIDPKKDLFEDLIDLDFSKATPTASKSTSSVFEPEHFSIPPQFTTENKENEEIQENELFEVSFETVEIEQEIVNADIVQDSAMSALPSSTPSTFNNHLEAKSALLHKTLSNASLEAEVDKSADLVTSFNGDLELKSSLLEKTIHQAKEHELISEPVIEYASTFNGDLELKSTLLEKTIHQSKEHELIFEPVIEHASTFNSDMDLKSNLLEKTIHQAKDQEIHIKEEVVDEVPVEMEVKTTVSLENENEQDASIDTTPQPAETDQALIDEAELEMVNGIVSQSTFANFDSINLHEPAPESLQDFDFAEFDTLAAPTPPPSVTADFASFPSTPSPQRTLEKSDSFKILEDLEEQDDVEIEEGSPKMNPSAAYEEEEQFEMQELVIDQSEASSKAWWWQFVCG